MNKQVLKQIKNVQVGDLMRVEWFDASTGKTAMGGPIDTPVKSWGEKTNTSSWLRTSSA